MVPAAAGFAGRCTDSGGDYQRISATPDGPLYHSCDMTKTRRTWGLLLGRRQPSPGQRSQPCDMPPVRPIRGRGCACDRGELPDARLWSAAHRAARRRKAGGGPGRSSDDA